MTARSPEHAKAEKQARYRRGHTSERLAAFALMTKGYRILARRYKSAYGEIDLIACRGSRLAFVEVKQRATIEACRAAITVTQQQRIRRAANAWLARHPRFRAHEMHFDAVFVRPWRWPAHMLDAA